MTAARDLADEGPVASSLPDRAMEQGADGITGVGGALTPMITLGIPGDPITAVRVAVPPPHGLRPGLGLFENQPTVIATHCAALFVAIALTGSAAVMIDRA